MSVDEKIIMDTILELLSDMTEVEWMVDGDRIVTSVASNITVTTKDIAGANTIVVQNLHRGTYDSVAQWRSCLALELKLALIRSLVNDPLISTRLRAYHAGPAQVAAEEAEWSAARYAKK
jgi:hypothetical protein